MSDPDFDVVVVGAGIAGAALLRALADSSLALALVEAKSLEFEMPAAATTISGPEDFDSRVSAITPASQAFLEELDVWSTVIGTRACPYDAMQVWDAEGTGRIDFHAAELDAPSLGHIVENRLLTASLLNGLDRERNLEIFNPASLAQLDRTPGGGNSLLLEDGRSISCRLLVAADGALSRTRELAAFRTREWDYGHNALVVTVETELSHGGTAYQRFLPTGPLAFLPLPHADGRHFCSIVWSAEPDYSEQLMGLDEPVFRERLGAAIEHRLGAILASSPRVVFPLRQRHAIDYVQPGLALVGDAAHTIHPLAGQGINLGLQDVAVLSRELRLAAERGIQPGQIEPLRRYQRQRKGENMLMMAAMDGFKRLFGERRLPVRWLRNQGMQWVDRTGPLKQQLMRHAMGVR